MNTEMVKLVRKGGIIDVIIGRCICLFVVFCVLCSVSYGVFAAMVPAFTIPHRHMEGQGVSRAEPYHQVSLSCKLELKFPDRINNTDA